MPADHPPDDLAHRRILKAIRQAIAAAALGGTPDVVYLSRDAADAMGVDYTPADPETAEGNE